MNWYFRKL